MEMVFPFYKCAMISYYAMSMEADALALLLWLLTYDHFFSSPIIRPTVWENDIPSDIAYQQ